MKSFSSIVRQNCARWVFIFGVLAELFFSGGEGIESFPFPVAEDNSSKITASVPEQNPKSYAFSVFSSRNYSTFLKSKFQKYIKQYVSGEGWKFDWSETGEKINFGDATRREVLHRAAIENANALVLAISTLEVSFCTKPLKSALKI